MRNILKKITAPLWRDVQEKPTYLGETSIAPSAIVGSATDGAVALTEVTSNPTDPSAGALANVYVKGDKLVIQFNDASTVRYKYLDLTGTGVTWVHTTVAP